MNERDRPVRAISRRDSLSRSQMGTPRTQLTSSRPEPGVIDRLPRSGSPKKLGKPTKSYRTMGLGVCEILQDNLTRRLCSVRWLPNSTLFPAGRCRSFRRPV